MSDDVEPQTPAGPGGPEGSDGSAEPAPPTGTTPPVSPERATPPVSPEQATPPVSPERATPPVSPERASSPVSPERAASAASPKPALSPAVREPASPSLFNEPAPRPVAKRPVARRPASPPALGVAPSGEPPAKTAPKPRVKRAPREMPRWFWLLATAELTFVVLVVVDAVSGWGDTPPGCFSGVCSLGQGVGIISLFAAVFFGVILAISFFVVAMRAASTNRRIERGKPT